MGPTKKQLAKIEPPPSGTGVVPPRSADPNKVWLTIERKFRVAEYESLTVNLGAAISIDPGETIGSTMSRTFAELKSEFGDVVEVMRGDEGL